MAIDEQVRAQMGAIIERYPNTRSAVMPLLHLVQSAQDEVSAEGMEAVADALGLTTAEVAAVATFYTMYKRRPVGQHHVGVCTNTLCGLLGGDAVYETLKERLGVREGNTSADGRYWLERIECQAACTHAPSMTLDWEFMDCQTPSSAVDIIDRLDRGETVVSTRGPVIRDFQATEHTLAFPDDGLAGQGGEADEIMLAGLMVAKERGMSAPPPPGGQA